MAQAKARGDSKFKSKPKSKPKATSKPKRKSNPKPKSKSKQHAVVGADGGLIDEVQVPRESAQSTLTAPHSHR